MISLNGHDIANHSYSHLRMGALGKEKIKNEIQLCGNSLEKLTNTKVDLFRRLTESITTTLSLRPGIRLLYHPVECRKYTYKSKTIIIVRFIFVNRL